MVYGRELKKTFLLEQIHRQILHARTSSEIAQIVLRIEEMVMTERLSITFLVGRKEWRESLATEALSSLDEHAVITDPTRVMQTSNDLDASILLEEAVHEGVEGNTSLLSLPPTPANPATPTPTLSSTAASTLPSFQRILDETQYLCNEVRDLPSVTRVSRQLFTILMQVTTNRDSIV